jgi:hypothetical protein
MDARLQEVLLDYGLEGYGLYWYCLELITNKVTSENITFALEHDARVIARNTGSTVQKVEEMMRKFINLGLFESHNGAITCLKLAKRLDKSMTNSPAMRGFIETMRENTNVMTLSDNVSPEEEGEQKKKEINNSYPAGIDESLLLDITEYWNTMMVTQPTIDLTKDTQINKKRWSKIKKILADHPDYKDHQYWDGHIDQLARLPDLQWQRDNKQLTFDQAVQLEKFERNLDLMRMGSV